VSLGAAHSRDAQPLLTTGCGYLPIGALPTGYLPIGALPTGAAGGGGSLRGRSAAAAALSMAKVAAVTVRIFSMTSPLCLDSIAAETLNQASEGRPPVFTPSLAERFSRLHG
jgi:hypothetical protein